MEKVEWPSFVTDLKKAAAHATTPLSTEFSGYARPKTRGELLEKLKAGTPCEVATNAACMTGIMLSGWLNFDKYTIRPSENKGWSVFEA